MYDETIGKLTGAAKKKLGVLNDSTFKYLVSSAFAGAFIGVGILLAFTVGGLMTAGGSPATKIPEQGRFYEGPSEGLGSFLYR